MGYTTYFEGEFKLDKPFTQEHSEYLAKFNASRRMKRDVKKLKTMYNGEHGLPGAADPYGQEGEFYVGGHHADFSDYQDASVKNVNQPPSTQPGLWCQWIPTEDGDGIEWDGGEKFYDYIEWLEYIIRNFIEPWGYKLSGEVLWRGEDFEDFGKIVLTDNNMEVWEGSLSQSYNQTK